MGTLVLFFLVNFHEFTGYAYIILYSKKIFKDIGTSSFTPREANYLVGVVNFLATVGSVFIIKRFSRRSLLIPGHVLMGAINILVGLSSHYKQDIASVTFILSFVVAYQLFNGPIIWLYIAEVSVDTALGFVTLCLWVSQFIIAFVCPYMNSAIDPEGCFFLFGAFSMIGAIFCYFCVKETRGLVDKEKKLLYSTEGKYKLLSMVDENFKRSKE